MCTPIPSTREGEERPVWGSPLTDYKNRESASQGEGVWCKERREDLCRDRERVRDRQKESRLPPTCVRRSVMVHDFSHNVSKSLGGRRYVQTEARERIVRWYASKEEGDLRQLVARSRILLAHSSAISSCTCWICIRSSFCDGFRLKHSSVWVVLVVCAGSDDDVCGGCDTLATVHVEII